MFNKILIIAGIVVFASFLMIVAGRAILRSQLEKNVNELFSLSENISERVYSNDQIKDLPDPVKRYFMHSLKEGQHYLSYIRLRHNGTFRLKPSQKWMPIKGEEYFTANRIGFVWFGKVSFFSVIDKYIEGKGSFIAKLFSFIRVAQGSGDKIDQGELLRWLGEAPWYPTAILPSDKIEWKPINNISARIILNDNGKSVSGIFYFDKKGRITAFKSKRYKEESLQDWTGYYNDYKEVAGMKIPHSVEVVWNLESGNFSYAIFNIDEIDYDNPSKFK